MEKNVAALELMAICRRQRLGRKAAPRSAPSRGKERAGSTPTTRWRQPRPSCAVPDEPREFERLGALFRLHRSAAMR